MQNLSDLHPLGCPANVLSYYAYIAIALLYTPKLSQNKKMPLNLHTKLVDTDFELTLPCLIYKNLHILNWPTTKYHRGCTTSIRVMGNRRTPLIIMQIYI
jgi:hypothetical protein